MNHNIYQQLSSLDKWFYEQFCVTLKCSENKLLDPKVIRAVQDLFRNFSA